MTIGLLSLADASRLVQQGLSAFKVVHARHVQKGAKAVTERESVYHASLTNRWAPCMVASASASVQALTFQHKANVSYAQSSAQNAKGLEL